MSIEDDRWHMYQAATGLLKALTELVQLGVKVLKEKDRWNAGRPRP